MKTAKKRFRVALLGIFHESNTFINVPTTLDDFINGHLFYGNDIIAEYANAFHEIGGIIECCSEQDIELLPVVYAEATPGGTIRRDAYEFIRNTMLDKLKEVLPVDGCLVVPHGAGVAEGYDDMDGDWLRHVRTIAGDVPIVGTLDPHANVSEEMVRVTDTLIAYSTNPHVDQRNTGRQAAMCMCEILESGKRPFQILRSTGLAISIEKQTTASFPCAKLYEKAAEIKSDTAIRTVSVILGFPYADVAEMGTSIIVTASAEDAAERAASSMVHTVQLLREHFVGAKTDVFAAVAACSQRGSPTLFLDMGDNVGGGAPGNSALILQAIENSANLKCFICINDPVAVHDLVARRDMKDTTLTFGGHYPRYNIHPFTGRVKVKCICDGKFSEDAPRHGGQVNYDMGTIAIIETEKRNTIMLTSRRTPPFSLKQITSFGIEPSAFDIIVAKGVVAPVAAYQHVCAEIVQVDTPGFTQADMTRFRYRNRKKPLYPFE